MDTLRIIICISLLYLISQPSKCKERKELEMIDFIIIFMVGFTAMRINVVISLLLSIYYLKRTCVIY